MKNNPPQKTKTSNSEQKWRRRIQHIGTEDHWRFTEKKQSIGRKKEKEPYRRREARRRREESASPPLTLRGGKVATVRNEWGRSASNWDLSKNGWDLRVRFFYIRGHLCHFTLSPNQNSEIRRQFSQIGHHCISRLLRSTQTYFRQTRSLNIYDNNSCIPDYFRF